MSEEVEEMAEAPTVEAAPEVEETPEQREARLNREDWVRRDAQAWADREAILRQNGELKPGESLSRDPEAAVRQRCNHCGF